MMAILILFLLPGFSNVPGIYDKDKKSTGMSSA